MGRHGAVTVLRASPLRAGPSALGVALGAVIGLALAASLAPPARAQGPTLPQLAVEWALGEYISPVVCELEGKARRGIRRIRVTPGPRLSSAPVARVLFVDMQVDEATRCFTELEASVPNLAGSFTMKVQGRNFKPDLAQRDFREAMRRHQGFHYDVEGGRVRTRPVAQPLPAWGPLDLRGAEARLRELRPGSDAAKMLADFPSSQRRLLLELRARDGTALRFPLVAAPGR